MSNASVDSKQGHPNRAKNVALRRIAVCAKADPKRHVRVVARKIASVEPRAGLTLAGVIGQIENESATELTAFRKFATQTRIAKAPA